VRPQGLSSGQARGTLAQGAAVAPVLGGGSSVRVPDHPAVRCVGDECDTGCVRYHRLAEQQRYCPRVPGRNAATLFRSSFPERAGSRRCVVRIERLDFFDNRVPLRYRLVSSLNTIHDGEDARDRLPSSFEHRFGVGRCDAVLRAAEDEVVRPRRNPFVSCRGCSTGRHDYRRDGDRTARCGFERQGSATALKRSFARLHPRPRPAGVSTGLSRG
jgi:hypothetical protein